MKRIKFVEQLKGVLTEIALALAIIMLGGAISAFIIMIIGQ